MDEVSGGRRADGDGTNLAGGGGIPAHTGRDMVAGATGSVLDAAMLTEGDVLKLYDSAELDFGAFWERISAVSLLMRMQVAYQVVSDPLFAERVFKAFSATARLRVVASVLTAESMEVS